MAAWRDGRQAGTRGPSPILFVHGAHGCQLVRDGALPPASLLGLTGGVCEPPALVIVHLAPHLRQPRLPVRGQGFVQPALLLPLRKQAGGRHG